MLGVRFPLFSKIMLWFFLNLMLLAVVFLLIFGLSFRFEPWSPLFGGTGNRIEAVSRIITSEIDGKTRDERDDILKRYSEAYKVDFYLFDNKGQQMAGKPVNLPDEVFTDVSRPESFGPNDRTAGANKPRPPGGLPPPGPASSVSIKSTNPTLYWLVIRAMTFGETANEQIRSRLIVRSDSYYGYGLFFDPRPWIAVAVIVLVVSILFWLPFVRSLTKSIAQMTGATKTLAGENFSVRVDDRRTDELGTLGSSINDLASRLSGFVTGQKRFLGDISHELNSPLARMQFALSILEERARPEDQSHIIDVKEEVELMSKLVRELLSYSKTGIQGAAVRLEPVKLRELVTRVVGRETMGEKADITIDIPKNLTAQAQPELLARAIANIIRNSINYAGQQGEINILAVQDDKTVIISISDNGPGVPDDKLEKIFDPLFRVQDDRSRATGGTGLGLAIVKTCVEACNGKVSAENIEPHGLDVQLTLSS
ncbi:MAG: HAMP domain-containing sensor histidine kinase [Pyrinomonadaceae bacterium]